MKKLYLVTGISGHLGSTVASALLESGQGAVRGFDLPAVRHNNLRGDVEMVYGDITKPEELEPAFLHAEDEELCVIHCAGIVSITSKLNPAIYAVNVTGTKNVLALCEKHRAAKLVYVSSVHAIPEAPKGTTITEISRFDPKVVEGAYAQTKAEATQAVLNAAARGLNATVVHPSGIIGPNDLGNGHLTHVIIDFLNSKLTAIVKGGYDFVDVRDVARGILAAAERGRAGECYILSNRYLTVKQLIDTVSELTGKKTIKTVLPLWFAQLTAPFAELYYRLRRTAPLYTRYSLYTLESNSQFSHEKATKELGYRTRDIRETLADTVAFLKGRGIVKPPRAKRAKKAAKVPS